MPHAADNRTLKHGCIVMASGVGARFGGNKLMAELCDAPLIGHVVRATDDLFSRRVVVARHADVAALCETLGAQVILHDEPCRNDTVRLGMEAMDGCDTVTFVQGDQPLIRPASIAALLRAAERDAAGAVRRDAAGRGVADVVGCDAVGAALVDAAEDYAMELDAVTHVDAAGCDAAESDIASAAKHDAVGCNAARAALHAFGAPASMACRARPCFFLHGRSTSFVLFPVVRAADSWRKRMRNAFEPLRFQANGSCSTWIRATIWSSCRHMLRAAAVQVCRADAFRRADFACAFRRRSRHVPQLGVLRFLARYPGWVSCCAFWPDDGCP